LSDEYLRLFMENIFNQPGSDQFLTPREVIRSFLDILSIIRQNPSINKDTLINSTHLSSNLNESIEEI
jgi:hypothetical protein